MNEIEKAREWIRFVKASQPGYRLNALVSVSMEGDRMLALVLKEMQLEKTADLFKWVQQP